MAVMSFPGLERAWLYRLFIMILILQIAAGKRKIGQSSISSAVGRAETVGQADLNESILPQFPAKRRFIRNSLKM